MKSFVVVVADAHILVKRGFRFEARSIAIAKSVSSIAHCWNQSWQASPRCFSYTIKQAVKSCNVGHYCKSLVCLFSDRFQGLYYFQGHSGNYSYAPAGLQFSSHTPSLGLQSLPRTPVKEYTYHYFMRIVYRKIETKSQFKLNALSEIQTHERFYYCPFLSDCEIFEVLHQGFEFPTNSHRPLKVFLINYGALKLLLSGISV